MSPVLLANGLSTHAISALRRAAEVVSNTGAKLEVIHAAPDSEISESELRRRLLIQARSALAAVGAGQAEVDIYVSPLDAGDAILSRAAASDADLIVLGCRDKPHMRDTPFGKHGTHVVSHSPIPVLIVRNAPSRPYGRMLLAPAEPDDASRLVEHALAYVPASDVFAVHAFQPQFRETLIDPEALARAETRQMAAFDAVLARVAAATPSTLLEAHHHRIAQTGAALSLLMDEVERIAPDLIVVGTSRRPTSTANRTLDALTNCQADLLIVPELARLPVIGATIEQGLGGITAKI